MDTRKKHHISDYSREEPFESVLSGSSHINISLAERIISIAGGLILSYPSFRRFNLKNILLSAGGSYLLYRGLSGHCDISERIGRDTSRRAGAPVIIKKAVTINKSKEEVYARWRELEKLPGIFKHLIEIKPLNEQKKQYHWKMKLPKGLGYIDWDAEIVEEKENEFIAYRTYNGSDVSQSGRIEFKEASRGRGTEMHASLKYYPPAGDIGSRIGKALNGYIGTLILADMKRFKHLLETGEITRIDGQPSGRSKNF